MKKKIGIPFCEKQNRYYCITVKFIFAKIILKRWLEKWYLSPKDYIYKILCSLLRDFFERNNNIFGFNPIVTCETWKMARRNKTADLTGLTFWKKYSTFYKVLYKIWRNVSSLCWKRTRIYCSTLIKKKIKFSSYTVIRNSEGSGAKSYITNDLLVYNENIFVHFLIFYCPCTRSHLNFLVYKENFVFFFISVAYFKN